MRLTNELIQRSPQFINCLKDRELDLRGAKVPSIENLGATQDQFDTLDLTDNEIRKLENFPLLKRLKTLMVANNRITRIMEDIGTCLPNLHTLVLSGNSLQHLSDVDALISLQNLRCLSLLENNVCKQPHYRQYVIHTLPQVRLLDFKKVKMAEREEAVKIFGTEKKATSALGKKTYQAAEDEEAKRQKTGPTPEQITAIQAAISSATTLEEVIRLEKQLKSGTMPDLPTASS